MTDSVWRRRAVDSDATGLVRIFNAGNGQLITSFPTHDVVNTLAFTPDGNMVAAAGRADRVHLYSLAEQQSVADVHFPLGQILAVAFSVDGESIVAVNQAGMIRTWNITSRRLETALAANTVLGPAVTAISRDGKSLAAASRYGEIYLWDIPSLAGIRMTDDVPSLMRYYSRETCNAPNIVLITVDDVGWGDLGVYGQQSIQTPALDSLSYDGLRLMNYYAGTSIGNPSRCAMWTGLHTAHTADPGQRRWNGACPARHHARRSVGGSGIRYRLRRTMENG